MSKWMRKEREMYDKEWRMRLDADIG